MLSKGVMHWVNKEAQIHLKKLYQRMSNFLSRKGITINPTMTDGDEISTNELSRLELSIYSFSLEKSIDYYYDCT